MEDGRITLEVEKKITDHRLQVRMGQDPSFRVTRRDIQDTCNPELKESGVSTYWNET